MKSLVSLVAAGSCLLLYSAELVTVESPGGQPLYRLSNQAVSFDVDPQQGGRIVRLVRTSGGADLAAAPSFASAPGGSGFFCDRIRPMRGGTARSYETSPYKTVSRRADAAGASLKLVSENGPLTIEKEYRIDNDTAQILLHYAISNPQNRPFTGSFWSCSAMPTGKDGKVTIFFPPGKPDSDLTDDLQKRGVCFSSEQLHGGNYFLKDPVRDYAAAQVDDEELILTAPYEYLSEFYSYQPDSSAQSARIPTLEFFTEQFVLKPLEQGKADAIKHPELEDPLADYIYRFTVRLDLRKGKSFDFSGFRGKPLAEKSIRFRPRLTEAPAFREFDTPAIPFLPRMPRPVKVLSVNSITGSAEMLELTRRVNMDLTIVEISHPHVLNSTTTFGFFSWTPPEPVAALRYALAGEYDVIILSQLFEKILPPDIAETIRKKVRRGTALLYAGSTNQFPSLVGQGEKRELPSFLTADRAVAALPVRPELTAEKIGKGTVFFLKQPMQFNGLYWTQFNALLPLIKGEIPPGLPYWEYYFAWYGKLLRFAAGLEPAAKILRSEWQPGLWQGTIHSAGDMEAELTLLADGREIGKSRIKLKQGDNELALPFSEKNFEHNGQYFCTVLLTTPSDSDCDTAVRTVQFPEGLRDLRTAGSPYAPGEPVSGSVEVFGSGELTCTLRDPAGRVLAVRTIPVQDGRQDFTLDVKPELLYPLADLTVELKTAGGTIRDQLRTSVVFRLPFHKKLNFILWTHDCDSPFFANYTRRLGELGFDIATGIVPSICSGAMLKRIVEANLRQGMNFAPMSMHRINLWKVKSIIRDPCLRDPAYRQKIHDDVVKAVAKASPFGTPLYYSGDENSLGVYGTPHDMCHSPHCLAAFRQAMKEKYGTLENLNRIWQSSFRSWEEVDAPTFAEASTKGNFTPWYEHRLFMMDNVSHALRQVKEELELAAPGARLGVSGQLITDIHGAFNWIDALPALDNPTAYLKDTDGLPDLIRSFRAPDSAAGAWIGYGAAQPVIRWKYWNQIMNGMFSPAFWCYTYFIRRGDGLLTSDGEFMRKLLTEIRGSGAEQMFAEAEAVPSRAALLYSIPSLVAAHISGKTSELNAYNYTLDFNGWSGLLRDLGFLPPQVVTHAGLENLDPDRVPLLILPMAQMLSDGDIAHLKQYVSRGGTLIADVKPGTFDEYGRRREKNPLDPLFGVDIAGLRIGKKPGKVNSAVPVHRQEGKGQAVYLNFHLCSYPGDRLRPAAAEPMVKAMCRLLEQVNFPVDECHLVTPGTTVAEYRADGNRYFGVNRAGGTSPAVEELNFGQSGYLYDTMHHRFLGEMSTARLTLAPHDAVTLALLPEKLEKLSGSLRFIDGKFQLTAAVLPVNVTTLVRLEVRLDGKVQRAYTAIKRVRGEEDFTVDPGLCPASGRWQFELTDLFTGEKIEFEHINK